MTLFGSRLKYLRINSNLTQRELAEIINVSTSTIGMYEKDAREPSFETLIKIASYFNVSIDYLLGYTNEKVGLLHNENSQQTMAEKTFFKIVLQYPELLNLLDEVKDKEIHKLIKLLEIIRDEN